MYHFGSKLFCSLFSSQLFLPASSGAYLLPAVPSCQWLAMSDADGFRWKLRQMVDRAIEYVETQTTKPYPKTNVALQSLRAAMSDEMPLGRVRKTTGRRVLPSAPTRKRRFTDIDATAKKHYDKSRRLQKENEELKAKLAKHTEFRSAGTHNHISPHWLVRAFLSQPALSARGGATSIRDVAWTAPSSRGRALRESGTHGLRCTYPWSSRLLLIG